MSSYYLEAGDTHFNWNKEPTFRCPTDALLDEKPDGPEWSRWDDAAARLGVDAEKLLIMVRRSHRHGRRERVDGKLTSRCEQCGARMRRLGYRAWIDEPIPESEWTEGQRASAAIGRRMGMGDPNRRTVRTTWHKTKKEAEAWARHEHKRAEAVAA